MPGTQNGGYIARDLMLSRDPDFYSKIGKIGNMNGNPKLRGFGAGEEGRLRARFFGAIGGTISRKGTKMPKEQRTKVTEAFKLKRDAYLDEIHREQRDKMASLAKKWGNGVRR